MGLGVRWIDSHCHLQDQYRPQSVELLEAAAEACQAGVGGLVCVGTDAANSREALSVAERLRAEPGPVDSRFEAWATVGLHPHEASAGTRGVEEVLERAATKEPRFVVAVGECGLDYHYDHSPRPDQRSAFAAQIAMANRFGLTLVVHSRAAWDDTFDILRAEATPERTVLHCFSGGPDEARRFLDIGAYLSFSGIITFKNATDVRDALSLCPFDRLLIETDAPFLAPVPHRGQPNRPSFVSIVGEAAAQVKSVSVEEMSQATVEATRSAFALS